MRQVQGAALASAVFGGLVLAWGDPLAPRWSPVAASELPPPVLAAGACLVFFLAIVLVVTSRRLGRDTQQTPSALEDPQVVAVDAADAEEVTDLRVLHAQIRTLEEALEQETALAREPAFTPEMINDAVEELHLRVRATVRGLAVRMENDPAAVHVLARVDAAVNRLMAPTAPFVRPTLTVACQVAMLPTEVPPAALNPVHRIAVEEAVPEVVMPEVVNPEVVTAEPLYAAPVLATPLDEEVVLPIPPRTPSPEIRRGRRWLRRSAA